MRTYSEFVGIGSDNLADLDTLLEKQEGWHSLDSDLGSNVLRRIGIVRRAKMRGSASFSRRWPAKQTKRRRRVRSATYFLHIDIDLAEDDVGSRVGQLLKDG